MSHVSALDSRAIGGFDPVVTSQLQSPTGPTEAARTAGFDLGYNQGLEAARQQVEAAMQDADKRVRRALAALNAAVDSFDAREAIALVDVEDAIVAGSFELSAAILQHEVSAAVDPGAEALARAMKLAPSTGDIVARLNPEDAETLSTDSLSSSSRTVRVVADPGIEAGGCIVEVGATSIDAQISSALANVAVALSIDTSAGCGVENSRMTAPESPLQ